MEIRIDSESDVPIRHLLIEQIVFLIATDRLTAGAALPSVRELARRLKIHHNTVSDAYQELVRRNWVTRRRGSKLVVAPRESVKPPEDARSLDDLINVTIRMARSLVPITFSSADEPLQRIRSLRQPSTIAVVSASRIFLGVARGLFAPAIGQRHALREILLPEENAASARSADIVFCDSIARRSMRSAKVVHYRLIAPESLKYVSTAMKSYEVRM